MVHDKDLGDMVNFTGRIPQQELLDVLSTADVCVNPDKPCEMNNISTMIKIMEYMALGKQSFSSICEKEESVPARHLSIAIAMIE